MLTRISLAVEICGSPEVVPAYVAFGDYNHAVYEYEGAVTFCSILPTDNDGVYTDGANAVGLGEVTRGERAIYEFFTRLASMSAYDFLSTYVLRNHYCADYDFLED
jgi:hypothetical protein